MPKLTPERILKNKQKVYNFVLKYPDCTAGEIAKRTGLSHVYAMKLASNMLSIKYKEGRGRKHRGMRTFYVV